MLIALRICQQSPLPLIPLSPFKPPKCSLGFPKISQVREWGKLLGGFGIELKEIKEKLSASQFNGKCQVRRICDKIFNQWAAKDTGLLAVTNLHVVTLMVYNSVNKQFLSPYKEPPSMEAVQNKVKELSDKKTTTITREQFYAIIMEWIQKDLRIVLANRVLLALLAAPLLAVQTKNVGRQVPRIRDAVDKVPTPLIASVYATGIVLLQDVRVD